MAHFRRHLGAAAALLLAGGAAQAEIDTPRPPGGDDFIVGVGVICNTGEQAEHYLRLRAGGAQLLRAVDTVNQQAREPRACGMAAVAFRRDKTMDTQRLNGKLVSVVRISVMAGYDGQRWAPVPAMVQYAVMEEDGVEV
jgi:hypothetical protein